MSNIVNTKKQNDDEKLPVPSISPINSPNSNQGDQVRLSEMNNDIDSQMPDPSHLNEPPINNLVNEVKKSSKNENIVDKILGN